jgi:acyl-CoA thioesterase
MNLRDLLATARRSPHRVIVPGEWSQGRACYGGLMAALLHEAMAAQVPDRPIRSMAMTFVGPAEPEVPIDLQVEVLREGSAVTSVLARALQNGQVMTVVQASFGLPRASRIDISAVPVAPMKRLEESTALPYMPGITPEYIRHLDMRWGIGAMPFSNTPVAGIGGWMQLRDYDADEPVTEALLLVLGDAWPPALLPYLNKPAPGSSLTWTIEFVQPMPVMRTVDWCRYQAVIEHARDGYGHTAAAMWNPAGELLALSRQTVTVFG